MNYSEKRLKLYLDSRKALNQGPHIQRAGRPYRHGKACVTSTPSGKGKSWINDVMCEIGNVNEFISIPSGKSWSEATIHPLEDIAAASEGARSAFAALGDAGRRGADAGNRWKMTILLWVVRQNLRSLKRYQLPKSTISDHLKDCFGWITC